MLFKFGMATYEFGVPFEEAKAKKCTVERGSQTQDFDSSTQTAKPNGTTR